MSGKLLMLRQYSFLTYLYITERLVGAHCLDGQGTAAGLGLDLSYLFWQVVRNGTQFQRLFASTALALGILEGQFVDIQYY